MLDEHLYWIISYSRWQDPQYWPLFKTEFLKLPAITAATLEKARQYNIEKYYYQGIGRHPAKRIYQMGVDDLKVIAHLLVNNDFILANNPHSIDASCYAFLANIYYFNIDTPLKAFISTSPLLVRYIKRIRGLLGY